MTRPRSSYRIIQWHHVSYKPEVKILLFRNEHEVITKLNRVLRAKDISENFVCLLDEVSDGLKDRYLLEQSQMEARLEDNQKIKAERKKQKKLRLRK